MKCPLLIIATLSGQGRYNWAKSDCLKEECAWWDTRLELCCIDSIVGYLSSLAVTLNKLVGKIPHEGQFRK